MRRRRFRCAFRCVFVCVLRFVCRCVCRCVFGFVCRCVYRFLFHSFRLLSDSNLAPRWLLLSATPPTQFLCCRRMFSAWSSLYSKRAAYVTCTCYLAISRGFRNGDCGCLFFRLMSLRFCLISRGLWVCPVSRAAGKYHCFFFQTA